ncbi:16S rRNA (cytosine(1402)-N(4))-methyltransferase [cyanobacterium TDX16]|nr:16S rRNA (cytosine(1402)-N(4))-methyltransferase [cyanobacterium TDX16]
MTDVPDFDDRPFRHVPVLRDRIVELFGTVPAGTVVDATLGGGGHAHALLTAHPHLTILGIDQDPTALAAAGERLAGFGPRVTLRRARFDDLERTMADLHLPQASGVLYDLGVSSPQLDRAERGFSFRNDGPLDMRMDPDADRSALDVVNGYDERRLAGVLRAYGDERHAHRIAKAIIAARPLQSTGELAQVIADAVPAPARRRGHPARRSFQAIRIEVNDELAILADSLEQALAVVAPLGRVAAIAYHSGEDRIVKQVFRDAESGGCTCPVGLPCECGAEPTVRLVKRGAYRPDAEEIATNPRSESARLRVVERLPVGAGDAR